MTPPKLTDEQIQAVEKNGAYWVNHTVRQFAYAIAALRDQQWTEMLAGSEPVAWSQSFDCWWSENRIATHQIKGAEGFARKVWHAAVKTHPTHDHTAVMRQALEALESARRGEMGTGHIGAAIAALKQELGEQP